MTDPIQKSLIVPLRPDQAFSLFTDHLAEWWPVDSHSLSAASGDLPRDVRIERKNGGHVIETKADGHIARWGTVTRWEPGRALGISWHVGRDETEATDVTVVFTIVENGTLVELTHGGFDRLGETAQSIQTQYLSGWDFVLGHCFATFCQRGVTQVV